MTWRPSQEYLGVEAALSLRGFAAVHHKTVGFLGCSTKPRPEARRVETGSGLTENLRCGGYIVGRGAQTWTAAKAWPPDGNIQVLTKLPLRGVYFPLSCTGYMLICLQRREIIYIALGLDGNSSICTTS
jgi:hypothetical protein